MAKNLCAKTVKRENAYEVWRSRDGAWTWYVLKKWQADDDKPYARWYCCVTSPFVGEAGEYGDVYVSEIKRNATRVFNQDDAQRDYEAERMFELRAAFGRGKTVVNVVTGRVTRT